MRRERLYLKIIKLPLLKEEFKKRKVAAYTRVSVSSDSLLHSLANQVSHYNRDDSEKSRMGVCSKCMLMERSNRGTKYGKVEKQIL